MVVTGLTKLKLGDAFKGYPNVTLVTSNGLVYSWGANMLTQEELDKYSDDGFAKPVSSTGAGKHSLVLVQYELSTSSVLPHH